MKLESSLGAVTFIDYCMYIRISIYEYGSAYHVKEYDHYMKKLMKIYEVLYTSIYSVQNSNMFVTYILKTSRNRGVENMTGDL